MVSNHIEEYDVLKPSNCFIDHILSFYVSLTFFSFEPLAGPPIIWPGVYLLDSLLQELGILYHTHHIKRQASAVEIQSRQDNIKCLHKDQNY